ncbi:MAG TPA: hypothetical protein VFB55_00390, partial [Verrucomicrobiae bacterium]|nr:hypothetical protein [Verrucomicrobiae bacterium]
MKTRFSTAGGGALIFLVVSLPFSTSAALQGVTALNSGTIPPPDGNGDSWAPIISSDGRFVLFASTADNLTSLKGSNGIPRLNPPVANVYLRDRLKGTTTLVSVNLAGTGGGDGNSFPAGLSTNGQFVLFESTAQDLVTNVVNLFWCDCGQRITNNVQNIFWRDLARGVTRLVNVPTNSSTWSSYLSCAGGAWDAVMTPDGRYVAFVSPSSNLTPNDTNGIPDVFVRDMQSNTTVLVSVGAQTITPRNASSFCSSLAGSSEAPEITPDGRFVVFSSTATNLVPGVTRTNEIYVRDLQTDTTFWASTNARAISGFGGNAFCYNQAISDDGRFVAFEICSNGPYPSYYSSSIGTNGFILRYNLQSGGTDIVASNAMPPLAVDPEARSLNLSSDGRFVVYSAHSPGGGSGVYLWDAQTGT